MLKNRCKIDFESRCVLEVIFLRFGLDFSHLLGAFWASRGAFGSLLGALGALLGSLGGLLERYCKDIYFHNAHKSLFGAPKELLEVPKGSPEGPRSVPGGSLEDPWRVPRGPYRASGRF